MSASPLLLDGDGLDLVAVEQVARAGRPVGLAAGARAEMERSFAWVQAAGRGDRPVYGVNTGFGSLARVRIPAEQSSQLSENLVRSHAAGVGPPVSVPVVRAMMLLRANALAKGASGCQPALVDTLVAMLNAGVTPVVPSQGSCGSSGDLAPLAHLGLVMMDGPHGEVWGPAGREPAGPAMARAGIPRLRLGAKDGLAITNGAQLTAAIAALAGADALRVLRAAELAAAMSIEALRGATRAFHPAVHALRPYPGAIAVAARLRALLAGSSLCDSVPGKVQDAYSLRCTPTVLGACVDQVGFALGQVQVELNAVTDNPVVLMDLDLPGEDDPDRAFSAGLFHGEPVGLAMDGLKLAMAEVGSLSERRLYRLTTGTLSQRLPPGLVARDRPELGMMLPHTTAAALVSENKALCWPASADSIPTCEDQEDHVAMSTTAARRAAEVVENTRKVVAIELLGAAWALRFRREEDRGVRLGAGTALGLAAVEGSGALGEGLLPAARILRLDALIGGGALEAALAALPAGEAP